MRMDQYIDALIEEHYNPKISRSIVRSIVGTVLINAICFSFGMSGYVISRNKSPTQMANSIKDKMYSPFRATIFESSQSKVEKYKSKSEYMLFMDSLTIKDKATIITFILNNHEKYCKWVSSNEWKKQQDKAS